jgi:hypothetical protein
MSPLSLSPNRRNSLAFSVAGTAGALSSDVQERTGGGVIPCFRLDVPARAAPTYERGSDRYPHRSAGPQRISCGLTQEGRS